MNFYSLIALHGGDGNLPRSTTIPVIGWQGHNDSLDRGLASYEVSLPELTFLLVLTVSCDGTRGLCELVSIHVSVHSPVERHIMGLKVVHVSSVLMTFLPSQHFISGVITIRGTHSWVLHFDRVTELHHPRSHNFETLLLLQFSELCGDQTVFVEAMTVVLLHDTLVNFDDGCVTLRAKVVAFSSPTISFTEAIHLFLRSWIISFRSILSVEV